LGFNFGTINIGNASPAVTLTFTFSTADTLGSIAVLTQGATALDFANAGTGTCTAGTSYSAGVTCSINAIFTPVLTGTRNGAVILADASGNVIATGYLQGTGAGPQVLFLPGTEITVPSSTLSSPYGVAVDGSGNVYISDFGNNRVLKETLSAGSYTETTVPSSTLNYPEVIAVDGAGNIYIADTNNNRILKETLSAGTYTEATVPTSALSYPEAVAVDGAGNIYIADTNNNRILEETLSAGTYTEATVPTSALNGPEAVAVDGNSNVYIADSGNNRVLKETLSAGTYTETIVPTSTLNSPAAVAVDGAGNVYIADWGNNRVLEEALSAGTYTEITVSSSALNYPGAVTVDGSGNVYIADSGNNRVLKEDFTDPPNLSFAATAMGLASSDSPRVITVSNFGNSALNFSAISYPIDFPESSAATGDCTASASLAAGISCTLTVDFTPVSSLSGSTSIPLSESVKIITNTLSTSATQQAITVTGTETLPVAATPIFSVVSGTYMSAQTVDISDSTSGATIYYTTDGSTPTISSTVYSGPITVSVTETLNAIAVAAGYSNSAVGAAAYTIE
jgi:streptogramin lyase